MTKSLVSKKGEELLGLLASGTKKEQEEILGIFLANPEKREGVSKVEWLYAFRTLHHSVLWKGRLLLDELGIDEPDLAVTETLAYAV